MNPFDLRGPQFLEFYLGLGLFVLAVVWFFRRTPPDRGTAAKLTDPYLIACLRGGPAEAIRVAVCSLIDRGLVSAGGSRLQVARPDAGVLAGSPLERAILQQLAKPREADRLLESPPIAAEARRLERTLVEWGLRVDPARTIAAVAGALLLFSVSSIRLVQAIQRGRTNVLFLILLTGLFMLALWWIGGLHRTMRGSRTLADLRSLFRSNRALASRGDWKVGDLALMTAVFGLGVASAHAQSSEFRRLFPKSVNERGRLTEGGATCGGAWSSCGSVTSCSSSGGSSCGGGGCGGGCGGCGGS